MITLGGIIRTLLTTKNWWHIILFFINPDKSQFIRFYGHPSIECTYKEYLSIKEIIWKGFRVEKQPDCSWIIGLNKGYSIFGDSRILKVLAEPLDKEYGIFDYRDKRVLDVGGYMGETAVLFAFWGAKHVVVYEPVPENINWVKLNVAMNHIDAEVRMEGIFKSDTTTNIYYNQLDSSIGLESQGKKSATIMLRNISDVVRFSNADIAKLDCEGAERYLFDVPSEILRLIPEWIIECHNNEIVQELINKFVKAGFNVVKTFKISKRSVLALKLGQRN